MELTIQRDTAISIHQQLVTQISLYIASGMVPEGTKLPSIRALSQKLNIHYNTCLGVYQQLAQMGLVDIRQGSGVVVSKIALEHPSHAWESAELQHMARYFVKLVLQKGYALPEVQSALEAAYQQARQASRNVVFVDAHADILTVFQAELEAFLGKPVATQVFKFDENFVPAAETLYLVSRYHYRMFRERFLGHEDALLVIDVGQVHPEIAQIKSLKPGSYVAVVSHSQIILEIAESMITGLRGQDLLIRPVLYQEGLGEIQQAAQHAQLILCDFLVAQTLNETIKKPVRTIRVIPDEAIETIKSYRLGH